MQREEKALEGAVEFLGSRATDIKNSISTFLVKLEQEQDTLNWPTTLDNFALISGQMNMLLKVVKNEKTPPLRNQIFLPLLLSPDRDEELAKLTENRVSVFSHEVVPDYLRTKPDPDVEAREQLLLQRSHQILPDTAQKQINSINKIANSVLDHINTAREEWESESGARANASQTSSLADTHSLISAVCLGKGLKVQSKVPTNLASGPAPQAANLQQMSIGKAPSNIKTTIKSASSTHPYSRC